MDISVADNPEAAGAGAATLAAPAAGILLEPLSIGRVCRSTDGYEEKYQNYRALEYRL